MSRPEPLPTDPTPTEMRWRIEQGSDFSVAFGIEMPSKLEHADRVAGKMILDGGSWRELAWVAVPLPSDVEAAKAMTRTETNE